MSNHTVEKLVYTRVINSYTILICLYLFYQVIGLVKGLLLAPRLALHTMN